MAKKSAVNRPLLGVSAKPKRESIKIEPETLTKLLKVIRSTWNAIGFECGEISSNAHALEVTIDANHVAMYGGPEGREMDKLLSELCEKYSYSKVHRFLLSKIGQLV